MSNSPWGRYIPCGQFLNYRGQVLHASFEIPVHRVRLALRILLSWRVTRQRDEQRHATL